MSDPTEHLRPAGIGDAELDLAHGALRRELMAEARRALRGHGGGDPLLAQLLVSQRRGGRERARRLETWLRTREPQPLAPAPAAAPGSHAAGEPTGEPGGHATGDPHPDADRNSGAATPSQPIQPNRGAPMSEHQEQQHGGIPDALWERIEDAAREAAADLRTARRFLELDGPFGIGLTSVETGTEVACRPAEGDAALVVASRAIAVPVIQQALELSVRRVEGHLRMGQPLDLEAVEDAAEAVARREDQIVYYGIEELGIPGLLTSPGRQRMPIGDWGRLEDALNCVLDAVSRLDAAGFRGPYALALSPARYNALFRRYEGSDMLQLDHLRRLCEGGVFKAPIEGALLLDPRAGRLRVGRELGVGHISRDGIHHRMFVSESLVLVLEDPAALCVLEEA